MVVAIIPARLSSTRFPNKPLKKIKGYSMIEHVYKRVLKAKNIDQAYIATCDDKIEEVSREFGAKVIRTLSTHVRGTDRVAEAASKIEADIVLNVQGDEPLVDPVSLEKAVDFMIKRHNIQAVNLVSKIENWEEFTNKNVVKAVLAPDCRVLYLSRQPIPDIDKNQFSYGIKQIGIYGFRKDFLMKFSEMPETPLEQSEKVDMLRIIENNVELFGFFTKDIVSVDVPEELEMVERIMEKDPLYNEIFCGQ